MMIAPGGIGFVGSSLMAKRMGLSVITPVLSMLKSHCNHVLLVKTCSLQPGQCSTPQENHHRHHHHSGAWYGMGEWSKGSNPYPQLIFIKGSKFATPSDLYVDDNKNMNLSCWGIKIRHPLWLLRWQGSLHQLIFLRDQKLAPPLTHMWCNICHMCYVLLHTSATSESDAEQRRGCSEHVKINLFWMVG